MTTFNRSALLERAVSALVAQGGDFEFIIVDDGSTDGTASLLARLAATDPRVVPLILEHNCGAATARNAGWRKAHSDAIVFTDDDCRAQPGWLETLVAALAHADIAQGRTIPDPAQAARNGPFSRTMLVDFEEGYYETCNVAYRRDVLEKEDGFDESFRLPYGEDTDLAWRAKKRGATTTFVTDAVVVHEVWPSEYLAHVRDMRRRGGLVHLFSKHPELRGHLHKGLFFKPWHGHTILAAGGLAAIALRPSSPTRWVAGGGLGLLYTWACRHYRYGPEKRRQWLTVVPLAFAADLYDVTVMARASVRYRTLLL